MCRSNKLQRRWRRPIKPGKVGGIDVCLAMPVPVPLLPRMFVCSHVCLCHADASNARVRLQQNTTRRSAPCHNLLQTVRYAACCTLHAVPLYSATIRDLISWWSLVRCACVDKPPPLLVTARTHPH